MTAKKLTEADKCEILKLYRNPEETTSTLAVRYGVSHSTISRLLKSTLSPSEYEVLIQQKRSFRGQSSVSEPEETEEPVVVIYNSEPQEETAESSGSARRQRRRSTATFEPEIETKEVVEEAVSTPDLDGGRSDTADTADPSEELLHESYSAEVSTIREMLGEDLLDSEEDLGDLEDDEEDLEDADEDDLDDEELLTPTRRVRVGTLVQVLPLSEASFPRPCYLVVDRAAELITRPLKDFGDLGQIPKEEVQQRTLPVFDNHRIARRFSNRSQRVIKVPDGRMLQKASPYLKAKGITRLLIDGQVYSLSPN